MNHTRLTYLFLLLHQEKGEGENQSKEYLLFPVIINLEFPQQNHLLITISEQELKN